MVTDERMTSSGRIPPTPTSPFDWGTFFVFAGSCGEGFEELDLLFLPSSNRATVVCMGPLFSSNSSASNLLTLPSRPSSPGNLGRAHPSSQPTSQKLTVFSRTLPLARSTGYSQVHEVPFILLCPPKGPFFPGINLDAILRSTLPFHPA